MFNYYQNAPFYPCLPFYPFYGLYNPLPSQYKVESTNEKFDIPRECKSPPSTAFLPPSPPTSENLTHSPLKQPSSPSVKASQRPKSAIINLILNQQQEGKDGQTKSRNILPNNINLILSYVRRVNRSGKTVARIIGRFRKEKERYNVKQFYSYQLYLKDNLHCQVNKDALKNVVHFCDPACSVFTLEQQFFYNKVCRALIYHFLKEESVLNLLNSKKMFKTKRKHHLESYRKIIQDMRENSAE